LKLRGYVGARGKTSGSYLLENCEIYKIRHSAAGKIPGWHNIARNTAAFCEFLNYVGGIYVLFNHHEADYKLENWRTILDVITKSNVTVMTLTEAIEHIRNIRTGFLPPGADADGDQERWTRTFVDSSDYSLNSSSPLIDAGADVGLTHDFAGTPVPQGQKPDIGLFEYPADPPEALLYSPVQPCRIFDSRKPGGGGVFGPGEIREISVYGDLTGQGGQVCPAPLGSNPEPSAAHLYVAAVPRVGQGNILLFPWDMGPPLAALLNYKTGAQNIGDSATVRAWAHLPGVADMGILNNKGFCDIVIDVFGYYYPSTPPP